MPQDRFTRMIRILVLLMLVGLEEFDRNEAGRIEKELGSFLDTGPRAT